MTGGPGPEAVRRRRADRARFLLELYRRSEEDVTAYVDAYEMAEEMGLSRQDAERIARYHEDHGRVVAAGGPGLTLRITARGIDHVEGEATG